MLSTVKLFLVVAPVMTFTIVFCWLIPVPTLLEIFMVSVGILIILVIHVWVVREIIKLMDFRHWLKLRQELREIEFERKVFDIRFRRSNRGYNHFH